MLIHLDWNLGDEVMAIPLFLALKRKYPGVKTYVQSRYPELFKYNPYVDGINPDPDFFKDYIIDIRREGRPFSRLSYWGGLLGLRVIEARPILYFSAEERQAIAALKAEQNHGVRIALSTWTLWESKRWKAENFRLLCEEISRQVSNVHFLEMGKDCPFLGLGENWIGRTDVRAAARILASCDLFIGNDSGLMHLAAAVGVPAIGLFGPVDPASLIESRESNVHPISASVSCQGCWSQRVMRAPDHCPLGEPFCMDSISPSEVAQRAVALLARKATRNAA